MHEIKRTKNGRLFLMSMIGVYLLFFILNMFLYLLGEMFLSEDFRLMIGDLIPMAENLSERSTHPDLVLVIFLFFWLLFPAYNCFSLRFVSLNKQFLSLIMENKKVYISLALSTPLLLYVSYVFIGSSDPSAYIYRIEMKFMNNSLLLWLFSATLFTGLSVIVLISVKAVAGYLKLVKLAIRKK